MAYQINKTDGTIVATVADGQVDTLSTDLTLIGKNYSGFGEVLNEDLIKLLENFASTATPTHPIRGQIWFDTAENKLKVYNGTSFVPVSSATISNTQPNTLSIGDLWFNNTAAQLYFFDGNSPILLGPAYSSTQGLSGLKVESILDTLNQTKVITYFYNNGILLGIFAKDNFTPKTDIVGYTGSIGPGFNAGTLAGIKFNVTCTNAEKLGGTPATTYVRSDTSNAINGQLRITTDLGIVVGSAGQMSLYVTAGDIYMSNASTDKNLILNVRKGITQENAIAIDAANRSVSIYDGFIDSDTNVGGNLIVSGNLTVEGLTTTLNTTELIVEDKNIVIANVDAPTDTTADGAGITIKGTTDKTVLYSESANWLDISETVNLATGKGLYIGGVKAIDGNSLGSAITSIPGVTSFGKQTVINIGPGAQLDPARMRLENNRLSTVSSDYDLELFPDGTGNIVVNGTAQIKELADPTDLQDAATKEYVDSTIESRPLVFAMDLSDGKSNTYIIANILNNLAPVAEYRAGTVARILCTLLSNSTSSLNINSLPPSLSTSAFLTNLGGSSANAVTNISFPTATIPAPSVSTTRIIKVFQIFGGVWTWQSDTVLPA
jgi:hypothetical protein